MSCRGLGNPVVLRFGNPPDVTQAATCNCCLAPFSKTFSLHSHFDTQKWMFSLRTDFRHFGNVVWWLGWRVAPWNSPSLVGIQCQAMLPGIPFGFVRRCSFFLRGRLEPINSKLFRLLQGKLEQYTLLFASEYFVFSLVGFKGTSITTGQEHV